MPLTVGGGVRTVEDIRRLLLAGADKVSINTAAVARPGVRARGGREVRQPVHRGGDRRQARSAPGTGRSSPTAAARRTGLDAVDWARRMAEHGAGEILLTSMDRDGTKTGFDLELTRAVADAVPVPVIASGGVGTLEHLVDGRDAGRRRGGARRLDLPLRRVHHRPGQGTSRARRRSDPTNLAHGVILA